MSISKKAWTGLALLTDPSTPPATAQVYHPCKSSFSRKKKIVYVDEDRNSRDANNVRKATVRQMSGTITGNWYNDTGFYLLRGFMGAHTTAQPNEGSDPTVYKHSLTLADNPDKLAVYKSYDSCGYTFGFVGVSKLTFKWSADGKLLECDATVEGQYGTKVGGALPTPSYSAIQPIAGYEPVIKFSGTQSNIIDTVTLTLEQKLEMWFGSGGGQDFVQLYYGDRSASYEFEAVFDTSALMDTFEADTLDELDVLFDGDTIDSTYNQELHLNFPVVGYDEVDLDTSKSMVKAKVKGKAIPGTTANDLFTADMTNTIATYTLG